MLVKLLRPLDGQPKGTLADYPQEDAARLIELGVVAIAEDGEVQAATGDKPADDKPKRTRRTAKQIEEEKAAAELAKIGGPVVPLSVAETQAGIAAQLVAADDAKVSASEAASWTSSAAVAASQGDADRADANQNDAALGDEGLAWVGERGPEMVNLNDDQGEGA